MRRSSTLLLMLVFAVPLRVPAQTVPPADLSTLSVEAFSDGELTRPYYLAHFHTLANSVRMSEPDRGFINLSVWRPPRVQMPNNARVMENVLSLVYFYATDRPWNPYYGDALVRARLEASLEHWLDLQSSEGLFPETGAGQWNLSATAFATKFMGEALHLLAEGPSIDAALHRRAAAAQRRAVVAVLSQDRLYAIGRRFTNQYSNVWSGALAYLDLYPDDEIAALLEARLQQSSSDFQSPAGFFYEHGGPDWSYDISTHQSNHLMAWQYLRGTELGRSYIVRVRRWYDWLSYGAVREPDGTGFAMNYAISTRQYFPFYRDGRESAFETTCTLLAEAVSAARAFCESREDRTRRLQSRRAAMEQSWPDVAPLELETPSSYSPYVFLHRHHSWHPSEAQKQRAILELPYLRRDRFSHHRPDDRTDFSATFVRRPAYYAAFNTGEAQTPQQRFGLGFVWTPAEGTLLQSQARMEGGAWGTRTGSDAEVFEVSLPGVRWSIEGDPVTLPRAPDDLPDGTLAISYPLGNRGEKSVAFEEQALRVSIDLPGGFTETLPVLLESQDQIHVDEGSVEVVRGEERIVIAFDGSDEVRIEATDRRIGSKTVSVVHATARNRLAYVIRF